MTNNKTDKTLSQQLCELCGIEPKILYKSKSNLSSGTCWKTREEYKNSACNQSWSETENTRYPDFEKPENFVKLFNLITHIEDFHFATGQTYISCIPIYRFSSYLTTESNQYESYSNDVVKAFLECLIEHVKEDKDTAEYIASEEWEY